MKFFMQYSIMFIHFKSLQFKKKCQEKMRKKTVCFICKVLCDI